MIARQNIPLWGHIPEESNFNALIAIVAIPAYTTTLIIQEVMRNTQVHRYKMSSWILLCNRFWVALLPTVGRQGAMHLSQTNRQTLQWRNKYQCVCVLWKRRTMESTMYMRIFSHLLMLTKARMQRHWLQSSWKHWTISAFPLMRWELKDTMVPVLWAAT